MLYTQKILKCHREINELFEAHYRKPVEERDQERYRKEFDLIRASLRKYIRRELRMYFFGGVACVCFMLFVFSTTDNLYVKIIGLVGLVAWSWTFIKITKTYKRTLIDDIT